MGFDDAEAEEDEDYLDENELEVEVSVKVGEVNSVIFSTSVVIDKTNRQQAVDELRGTVELLRRSAPVEEFAGMDAVYYRKVDSGEIVSLNKEGAIGLLPYGRRRRRRFKKGGRPDAPETQREGS